MYTSVTEISIFTYISVPVAQWLEHCASSAKVVGSIPREHMYKKKKMYNLNALCVALDKSVW